MRRDRWGFASAVTHSTSRSRSRIAGICRRYQICAPSEKWLRNKASSMALQDTFQGCMPTGSNAARRRRIAKSRSCSICNIPSEQIEKQVVETPGEHDGSRQREDPCHEEVANGVHLKS